MTRWAEEQASQDSQQPRVGEAAAWPAGLCRPARPLLSPGARCRVCLSRSGHLQKRPARWEQGEVGGEELGDAALLGAGRVLFGDPQGGPHWAEENIFRQRNR